MEWEYEWDFLASLWPSGHQTFDMTSGLPEKSPLGIQ